MNGGKVFNVYENTITALYEACKPEILGRPVDAPGRGVPVSARGDRCCHRADADIDAVARKVGELLDESVVVDRRDGHWQAESGSPVYQIMQ